MWKIDKFGQNLRKMDEFAENLRKIAKFAQICEIAEMGQICGKKCGRIFANFWRVYLKTLDTVPNHMLIRLAIPKHTLITFSFPETRNHSLS